MTASTFRMYLDKGIAHIPATKEEIVEGSVFLHRSLEYTVTAVEVNKVRLEAKDGAKLKLSFVDINEITKSGSKYVLKRDS